MASIILNTKDVNFILLEDEQDPNFEKYKNIFEKSKIIEYYIKDSYTNYSISIKDFDTLLYENLSYYNNVIPTVQYSNVFIYYENQ